MTPTPKPKGGVDINLILCYYFILNMLEFDKKYLKFIGSCPVCQSNFDLQNIKLLKNRGATSLLHVDCRECESSLLVTLIKNNTGVITNVSVLTDLYKEDFLKFKDMPVIAIDNDNFRTKK